MLFSRCRFRLGISKDKAAGSHLLVTLKLTILAADSHIATYFRIDCSHIDSIVSLASKDIELIAFLVLDGEADIVVRLAEILHSYNLAIYSVKIGVAGGKSEELRNCLAIVVLK